MPDPSAKAEAVYATVVDTARKAGGIIPSALGSLEEWQALLESKGGNVQEAVQAAVTGEAAPSPTSAAATPEPVIEHTWSPDQGDPPANVYDAMSLSEVEAADAFFGARSMKERMEARAAFEAARSQGNADRRAKADQAAYEASPEYEADSHVQQFALAAHGLEGGTPTVQAAINAGVIDASHENPAEWVPTTAGKKLPAPLLGQLMHTANSLQVVGRDYGSPIVGLDGKTRRYQ